MSAELILPVVLFVVFFGCALLIVFALPSRGDKKFQERLEVVREGFADPGSELLIRQRHLRNLNPAERVLEELPGMERLAILSDQAGVPAPGYQTVLKMLVVGAAFGALAWFFGRPVLAAAAAIAGAATPVLNLYVKRNQRIKQFEEQLPDALDMMARALRAGNPLTESFRFAADEMQDPIAREFGITSQHLTYGLSLKVSFDDLQERIPTQALGAMITAILVQRETGGNLAEVLDKIAAVIRTKLRFQRKLRALTAEGRMSANVLIAIPFLLAAVMSVTSPDYLTRLTGDPLGQKLIMGMGVMMLIGIVWIRKVVKVRF